MEKIYDAKRGIEKCALLLAGAQALPRLSLPGGSFSGAGPQVRKEALHPED